MIRSEVEVRRTSGMLPLRKNKSRAALRRKAGAKWAMRDFISRERGRRRSIDEGV